MFEEVKKIAQAEDPIINNLAETENKLHELNQQVGQIIEEYNKNSVVTEPSFFNFDNPFFLLVLVGLVILAFSLWFLRLELNHYKVKKVKVKKEFKEKPEKIEVNSVKAAEDKKPEPVPEPKPVKKTSTKKVRKIKVVKVK